MPASPYREVGSHSCEQSGGPPAPPITLPYVPSGGAGILPAFQTGGACVVPVINARDSYASSRARAIVPKVTRPREPISYVVCVEDRLKNASANMLARIRAAPR